MVNIHCKKENCISDQAFFELVIPSLVSLLKIVCNIDLDLMETPFKQDLKTTGGTLNISYKCQYCKANVSLRNDILSVSFNFFLDKLEHHKIPLNSQRCNIHVDNDLTFKHAEFNYYANFQKLKIDPNSDGDVYSSLNITQTINSGLKKENTVSYLNGQTKTSSYINLKEYGLNPTFLKADPNFDSVLVEMMTFSEKKHSCSFLYFRNIQVILNLWKALNQQSNFSIFFMDNIPIIMIY